MEKIVYNENSGLKAFIQQNRDRFEERLLYEAVNVRDKIEEILEVGNIDLLNNAHKLVLYVVEEREEELDIFARQEGIAWAAHSLTLAFKLEWVQAIRRTLWDFMRSFQGRSEEKLTIDQFFDKEKQLNNMVDQFVNTFFISYSDYKDRLIAAQKELVDKLSVPIIPITKTVCILPLIGKVDARRTGVMEEKVLMEIGEQRMQTMIVDLSAIADMDIQSVTHLLKIIEGAAMMGCETIITGMRPDNVRQMIGWGMSFDSKAVTKGSLQQALKDVMAEF